MRTCRQRRQHRQAQASRLGPPRLLHVANRPPAAPHLHAEPPAAAPKPPRRSPGWSARPVGRQGRCPPPPSAARKSSAAARAPRPPAEGRGRGGLVNPINQPTSKSINQPINQPVIMNQTTNQQHVHSTGSQQGSRQRASDGECAHHGCAGTLLHLPAPVQQPWLPTPACAPTRLPVNLLLYCAHVPPLLRNRLCGVPQLRLHRRYLGPAWEGKETHGRARLSTPPHSQVGGASQARVHSAAACCLPLEPAHRSSSQAPPVHRPDEE